MKDLTDLPIVVVEDDPFTLSLFGSLLEGQGYRRPVLFDSSVKALQFLHDLDAALVIVDLVLPEISGMELLRHVISHKPHIPVIVVSGLSQIDTAIECMRVGAVDYLTKPLEVSRLASSLTRALALRQTREEEPVPEEGLPPGATEETGVPFPVPERLCKAAAYMERNISHPLYLEAVAQEACLSKFHFCREFKKYFGISPMQFMLQRRIAQATSLLQENGSSISQVAVQCGFSDQSEFTKWFKKATGQTPSSYRNAAKPPKNPPSPKK